MTNYDFFRTIHYPIKNIESNNYIFSDDLLGLIKDTDLKDLILNKYNLDKNIKIEIDHIDVLFDFVKSYVERFDLFRLDVKENDVITYLELNNRETTC